MDRNRRRFRHLGLIILLLLLTGCLDRWQRPEKQPTSALWVGANNEPLTTSSTARLKELGVGELFLEVGIMKTDESSRLAPVTITDVPPSAATLVIGGRWVGVADPSTLAESIFEDLRDQRFEAESKGIIPAGYHFDLRRVDDFAGLARFLEKIRDKADRTLLLSVSISRSWLESEDWRELIGPVDFIVPFLYGQRVYEREASEAWDFLALQRELEKIEELDVPYFVGLVSLGTATHLNGRTVKARTTRLSVKDVVWNPALEVESGFSLDGVNRRVYTLKAKSKAEVGSWNLNKDDSLRIVRGSTSDLEELHRLVGAWGLENHLGQVYYRLPRDGESMSLQLDNLFNALDPAPAEPDLKLEATVRRRSGRGWIFRFTITNLNGEITELSFLENNYLQVTAKDGRFFRNLGVGDFFRYDLGIPQPDGTFKRDLRPTTIRLHAPILEGRQKVESGDVELILRGEPVLDLEASFLLPDGRTLRFGPYTWRDGKLDDGRDAEE